MSTENSRSRAIPVEVEVADIAPGLEVSQGRALGSTALRFATEHGNPDSPEIFDTIQGEGRNLGTPVVFARLSGCNLQCSWCDTPYTWAFTEGLARRHDEKRAYKKSDEQVSLEVGDAIDQISGYPIKRLVITGGEPMLQQKGIESLVRGLKQKNDNYWVEVETNGTIEPTPEVLEVVDQFNVSPKLANSGNSLNQRQRHRALKSFASTPKADFKFVMGGLEDLSEVLEIVERFNIPHERVFLMPEGRTEAEIKQRQLELVDIAKASNFNLTTRLHVLIWGAKRGV